MEKAKGVNSSVYIKHRRPKFYAYLNRISLCLRAFRTSIKLSQKEMGRAMGITGAAYANYEVGNYISEAAVRGLFSWVLSHVKDMDQETTLNMRALFEVKSLTQDSLEKLFNDLKREDPKEESVIFNKLGTIDFGALKQASKY